MVRRCCAMYTVLKCLVIGTLLTPATWIREFVTSHPDYRKDSVVSQVINYDLLKAVDEMFVKIMCPYFLTDFSTTLF